MIFEKIFKGNQWRSILQELLILNFDESREYSIEIKEKERKRSLDANAYFWLFLDKLSEKLGIDKKTIYRELIRNIGGVSDVICLQDKAVDTFISAWEKNGLGWFCDTEESKLKGCTNVIIYYGSSTYDKEQFSRLIDLLMVECQECEIDTTSLKERALLEGYNV